MFYRFLVRFSFALIAESIYGISMIFLGRYRMIILLLLLLSFMPVIGSLFSLDVLVWIQAIAIRFIFGGSNA